MPLPALLKSLLTQQVSFEPKLPTDRQGEITYGPTMAPVPARLVWDLANRSNRGAPGQESITEGGTVYLDSMDYNAKTIPVGSRIVLPDGNRRIVTAIHEFIDEVGSYAWRISWS